MNDRRLRWFSHGSSVALCVLTLGLSEGGAAGAPLGSVEIAKASIELGSTLREIMTASEQCSRSRKSRPCPPEEFSEELGDGTTTFVPAFFMDRYEVSVRDYERCVRAARCRAPGYELSVEGLRRPSLPVVLVSQADAQSFCSFRGARLPTEAEFESAARGLNRRIYPWGNLFNRARSNAGSFGPERTSRRDGFHLTAPVDAFSVGKSPQGVFQLAGNVAEWTDSDYVPHGSQEESTHAVVKGGSYASAPVHHRGAARRGVPRWERRADIGFRCAIDASGGASTVRNR